MSSVSGSYHCEGGPKIRFQRRPDPPSPAAVASIERSIAAPPPPSSGWARSTSGQSHSSPWRSSSSETTAGDATAIGWVALCSSCSRPGTVSSELRVPPPIVSSASITVTSTPRLASTAAQASPLGPEPTTTALLMTH